MWVWTVESKCKVFINVTYDPKQMDVLRIPKIKIQLTSVN